MMVTNPTWDTMALSVINRLTSAIAKLNTILKIRKYRRLQKGHHFIPMAMEVHNATRRDMDHFIKECVHLFHNRQSKGHLSLSFRIQFFKQHVSIVLQHALLSTIERKIALVSDVCSRPPTIIRSNNLHVGDIRKAMGEIASYHKRD
jgi:hypothetical protein